MKKYYTVEITRLTSFVEVYTWAVDQFGESMIMIGDIGLWDYNWSTELMQPTNIFLFKREADAVLFALRWK